MHWTRYDVFLSYARRDSAVIDSLVEALRQRGYSVFYDKESIVPGEPWKQRLAQAIRESRVCILCWSEYARNSEYVSFEYSRAQGLEMPVLPWLLDSTPLPQMIEIQGVLGRNPATAASQLLPRLGWRLTVRRRIQTACLFFVFAAFGLGFWRAHQPPPPWEFSGRVVDSETRLPVPGVRVEAEEDRFSAYTDSSGTYVLRLAQPKPRYLHLTFAKPGYKGEEPVNVSPDRPFNTDMTHLR